MGRPRAKSGGALSAAAVAAAATDNVTGNLSAYAVPVVGTQAIQDQFTRIGGELTPQRVTTILRSADSGQPAQFVDLTHESRQKDGHFQAIMQSRELALSRLDWGMQAPEDADQAEQDAAAACEAAIRACRTFPAMLAHLNGEGLLFAHATSEEIWRLGTFIDQPILRGLLIPDRFENLSCRRFGFRSSDAKLLFDTEGRGNVDNGGVDLLEEYPRGKFIRVVRRINGDVLIREGLARVLVWASLFRNWTLRDWLSLAELAWKPLRTAQFKKPNATSADVSQIQTILSRLTSLGWAVYPDSVELNIEFPRQTGGGTTAQHQILREHLGMEMSKAVLGGTLTAESGSRGARSLGEVHERMLRALRDADATEIASAIQTFVVEPFYRLNYGESVRPAEFFFHTEDAVDTVALATMIKLLVEAGDDKIPIAWAHDQLGIETAAENEDGTTEPVFTGTGTTESEPDDGSDETTDGDDGEDPDEGDD